MIPNSYPGVCELKCSCVPVYNGETKKKIISRSTERQQESIKGNWSPSGATEHTKECHGHFDWLHPKTLKWVLWQASDGIVGQDKLLNSDYGNFVKTNAWKPLLKKMKALHWNLMSFCIKWWFCFVLWSIGKRLQSVWLKCHVLNNKTCVVLLANFDV